MSKYVRFAEGNKKFLINTMGIRDVATKENVLTIRYDDGDHYRFELSISKAASDLYELISDALLGSQVTYSILPSRRDSPGTTDAVSTKFVEEE